jgi:RimJ/RimL family protein N-acetyltransferase
VRRISRDRWSDDVQLLSDLDPDLNFETVRRGWMACAFSGPDVVGSAGCYQWTDRFGDLGVDTNEAYRRQGIATAAAVLVASALQESGRTPVWRTSPDNHASLAVAAKLGFEKVGQTVFIARRA